MEKPLISVVIPAYNAEKYIKEAINSILNQSYSNVEIWVADDASSDQTKSVVDKLASNNDRVHTDHNEVNLGYLKTCNKLKARCQGQYITFQDSDDYSDSNRLQILFNFLIDNPHIGMVGSNFTKIRENGEKVFDSNHANNHEGIIGAMPAHFNFCGATFMLKIEVYKTIGGYHEYFDRVGAEDMYWVYLISEKFKVHILPDHLYFYRFNPTSVSSTIQNKKKLFSMDLVRFLIQQRIDTRTDALSNNRIDLLEKRIELLNEPYVKDRLLFRKRVVQRCFWNGDYGKAYKAAFGVLIRNPFQNGKFYKDLYIYLPRWIKG
ncbi:MAG: glycosyltransferase involved in cell wall biosynthesis [Parvicellaceae bacterium]